MDNKVNILMTYGRVESALAVQAILDSPKYNIITANSEAEALTYLFQDSFALILLDIQFESATILRERENFKDIPIIFMSDSNQHEQYIYQNYGDGFVDYLLAPFNPYIFKSKVAVFVDLYLKKQLIKEQAQKIEDNELQAHAASISHIELESFKRYQNLADSIPQIVFRVRANGVYEYFNKVWFEYTGLSPEYSLEMKWKDVIYPSDLENLLILFEHSKNTHGQEIECRILNKFGEFRWHLIRIQPEFHLNTNEIKFWLGTAADIEDRKKSEDIQRFLSLAGEILVSSLDSNYILESISKLSVPALADWCSFDIINDEEDLKNVITYHREPLKIGHAKAMHSLYTSHPNSEEDILKVLASGKANFYREAGKKILTDTTLSPQDYEYARELSETTIIIIPLIAHGHTLGSLTFANFGVGKNYTNNDLELGQELGRRVALALENAKLYLFSQRAIEVRNDFLSIASHELNTPITSVKLHLQMVNRTLTNKKDELFPLERFKKSIDTSVKQVDRLIHLVQVLLDVSRIQSGQFNFVFDRVNVSDMVTEVIDRHKELLQSYSCNLTVKNLDNISVIWDKTRMEQVITNLINNAVKYAPGKIEVSVLEDMNNVKISVKDYGVGIPADKIHRIFDRFERGNSPESVSGLGLGLYIVKQIIEGHHGKIEIESKINQGSCFAVIIPKNANQTVSPQQPIICMN